MEADIAVVRTLNHILLERLVKTGKQCWKKAQHSQRDTQKIFLIPNSVDNSVLEETVCGVFKKSDVEIAERDVQLCFKFVSEKYFLQTHTVKKELKSFDPTDFEFYENTKIIGNES